MTRKTLEKIKAYGQEATEELLDHYHKSSVDNISEEQALEFLQQLDLSKYVDKAFARYPEINPAYQSLIISKLEQELEEKEDKLKRIKIAIDEFMRSRT